MKKSVERAQEWSDNAWFGACSCAVLSAGTVAAALAILTAASKPATTLAIPHKLELLLGAGVGTILGGLTYSSFRCRVRQKRDAIALAVMAATTGCVSELLSRRYF